MTVQIDRITVTFYGDDEVKVAEKFRDILMRSDKSINDTLKKLIYSFVEEQSRG